MYNFIVSSMETILITGGAGFIGSLLADELLKQGNKVICIDNFDDYYDPAIKHRNISEALTNPNYTFIESDIIDIANIEKQLNGKINAIIHLAAKAGVRNSIINPTGYEQTNILSITKALELTAKLGIEKFIFASSSSIYGNSKATPFKESQIDLNPLNPYAKSKLISEHIGKDFCKAHDINFISLRLFSVYGPRLRPDLLMHKIVQSMLLNEPLKIFGTGDSLRDFTHVDDIIAGFIKSLNYYDEKFNVFNLGNGIPISIKEIISIFEDITGEKIQLEFSEMIQGESDITWADNNKAKILLNFNPEISIYNGIKNFLSWYNYFYHTKFMIR